jgi:LCP family protein required for cell wall assembly
MAPFKTKKLQKKSLPEISTISQERSKEIWSDRSWNIKKKVKIFSAFCLLGFSGFFIAKVATEAFRTNKINGSETVNLPIIAQVFETKKVEGTMNILIAGIGGRWHDGGDLTDSIMLASLDAGNNRMTLLSIPRDLYVAYRDDQGAGRINTLYDLGKRDKKSITYLAEKVSEITGQTIDKYLVIDFAGFKNIIDALGGVSLDVPEDLIDREYPDNNWWYETFIVRKGLQDFDGETALKYARSRHSTSDFDRSERQQLIIKALKEKATELGIITDQDMLRELYTIIERNIDTDMNLVDIGKIGLAFSDIKSEDIGIVNLSDVCLSLTKCQAWSYLYTPSRDLFAGNSVVIPENALPNKLSYYTDIRRFVDITFRFPTLRSSPRDIVIIHDPSMKRRAQEIGIWLAKMWFPISFEKALSSSTGSIEISHANIYWHEDFRAWINPDTSPVLALKYLEESLPVALVKKNEYINTSWPKIEIVIGKDGNEYFKSFKNPYYIAAPARSITSGEVTSTGTKAMNGSKSQTGNTNVPINKNQVRGASNSWEVPLEDGWEDL